MISLNFGQSVYALRLTNDRTDHEPNMIVNIPTEGVLETRTNNKYRKTNNAKPVFYQLKPEKTERKFSAIDFDVINDNTRSQSKMILLWVDERKEWVALYYERYEESSTANDEYYYGPLELDEYWQSQLSEVYGITSKLLQPIKNLSPQQIVETLINYAASQGAHYFSLVDKGITILPTSICKLRNLEFLDLSFNELEMLPVEIGELRNLQSLAIISNKLRNLPEEICKLTNLTYLHLGGNQLSTLPSQISALTNITTLILVKNQIGQIPNGIKAMKKLNYLNLELNPLPLPPEIINKKVNPKAILNYYFSGKENWRSINQVKVLLVGQGSVGKTSIIQQILYGTFNPTQGKTDGICINHWQVKGSQDRAISDQPQSEIRLNIWDFGGQEIMHATHQFFLTKRSLYLLVLDARLAQEENRVEYWLKIIQSFGGESPVLIVGNKTDQHPLDIDRTGLSKKYPNIVGILETSAATGAGIERLKEEITRQANSLPHIHDLLPETWFAVKNKLEKLGQETNFISHDDYDKLCDQNDVRDETSQQTLIGFLHDLGIVLYFQDDPRLESLGILNPQWVTNGVYRILNSHELFQNRGKLTLPLLNQILNIPEYPKNKHLFIIDMMKKFELCYDIEPDKSFLIPDLLPKDEPYTGEWDNTLAFQYHYNVLPSSIISRFIVRMNAFIYKTVWRSGVILKSGENAALVRADYEDRTIDIWISGSEATRRDLLSAIRMEFDAIHKTIAKIEATEKVPLPNAPEAAPIDLIFLQRMASEGREFLPVQAGNQIIDLVVKEVLSRIEKEHKGNVTNIYVGGAVSGNMVVGNENDIDR